MGRPPSSTLFPYTTLFRSRPPVGAVGLQKAGFGVVGEREGEDFAGQSLPQNPVLNRNPDLGRDFAGAIDRSEEHTSELQSHSDLVCRLLLEKKKKNTQRSRHCKLVYRPSLERKHK